MLRYTVYQKIYIIILPSPRVTHSLPNICLFSYNTILYPLITGKVVHGEATTAHCVLNGMHYYHQDWAYAAAHVTVPPLRLDPSTPNFLMSLLGK